MTEELNEKDIEVRSADMDELLTRVPSWLIRRGAVLLTFIVIFLLVGSWFFHYPDSIVATITITSANPPSSVVARTGGKLISFLVADNQDVVEGDYLAVLENSSDMSSVNKLLLLFQTVDTLSNPAEILELNIEQLSNLGDLQSYYINFLQAFRAYNRYQSSLLNKKKIMALQQQIDLSSIYVDKLNNQRHLQEKELKIAQNQFNRDSLLFTQKLISPVEFEKSQTQIINSIYTFKNSEMTLINSRIQVDQLRQQVIEVKLSEEKEIQQLIDEVNNSYKTLKSQFDTWELTYVLKSPVSGKVTIGNYWSENQNVKVGDIIMSVVPAKTEIPFGKLTLTMENSGKVKVGQKVNIRLSGFAANEFGMLTGKVSSLSLVPEQGKYYVKVDLINGLTTNYNRQLPFMQEMTGNAEIITDDLRLIERIIGPIRLMTKEKICTEIPLNK